MFDLNTRQVYVTSSNWSMIQKAGFWSVCFLFLLFIQAVKVDVILKSGLLVTLNPVLSLGTQVVQVFEHPFLLLHRTQQSVRRVAVLETQYAQSLAELVKLEGVERENQELRKLLENTDRTLRQSRIASSLVSLHRPAVSVGQESGVQAGNGVIANGVLLGTISEVNQAVSFVSLLHQPEHQPVLVQTQQGTQGITSGSGRMITMEEVPLDMPLEVGDTVVTVGQPGLEKDLLVGKVVRVIKEPAAPVKKAHIEQLVDFYQSRVVEIVL